MAVAFMIMLEDTPDTYDRDFDDVLEGRASRIRERILDLVHPGMRILDLGCGPGYFAIEAAKRGATVIGVDANGEMITLAQKRAAEIHPSPVFIKSDVLKILEQTARSDISFDLIVSTFLLSELTPVERQVFLRRARRLLGPDGRMIIAAEVLPEDTDNRRVFWRNRQEIEKNIASHELARRVLSPPITDLSSLMDASGLDVLVSENYGPEIGYIESRRADKLPPSEYEHRDLSYDGSIVRLRMAFDRIPGAWRGIPIPPGLYRAGFPSSNSPAVVTANYEHTYYTVMRALKADDMNAWVLVCDTDGINVWCAARGISFNTDDVINMMYLTRLDEKVAHNELILPQLSAAGVVAHEITTRTKFRARYGPVRIQDLSAWLDAEMPSPKPREMATVTFDIKERMTQALVHLPFLMKMGLIYPFALTFLAFIFASLGIAIIHPALASGFAVFASYALLFLGELLIALFGYSLFLGLVFPILPSRGNSFIRRGIGLAIITLPIGSLLMISLGVGPRTFISWLAIQFILSIAMTLDWSGLTTVSDPKAIRAEYPLLRILLAVGIPLIIGFNIVTFFIGW
ncbi:MAG: methyltransferase domain-containing protein [Candidatus Thorarchaeota archaeon]